MIDFATIMRSTNIVCAVSTFSFMAAWLSEAKSIHLPAVGLFNPAQASGTDLLPVGDKRFHCWWFPQTYAQAPERTLDEHRRIDGKWSLEDAAVIRRFSHRAATTLTRREAYLRAYDEEFYLAIYADIREAVERGALPSGRHHYEAAGYFEGRAPFLFDGFEARAAFVSSRLHEPPSDDDDALFRHVMARYS